MYMYMLIREVFVKLDKKQNKYGSRVFFFITQMKENVSRENNEIIIYKVCVSVNFKQ